MNEELDTFDFDVGGLDNLDLPDFNFDYIPEDELLKTRYTLPKITRYSSTDFVCYEKAERLARDIKITEGARVDCFIDGSFIFGDFLEAFLIENKARAVKCTISTLSLSQENVDSLEGLLKLGYIKELNLITSVYFWANERNSLVPYIYERLDIDNRFQYAVADIHTKTIHFQTLGGKFIVIHGSANLRTSANIEQFTIEENKELYNFYEQHFTNFIEKYATIRKPIRNKNAWRTFTKLYFKD